MNDVALRVKSNAKLAHVDLVEAAAFHKNPIWSERVVRIYLPIGILHRLFKLLQPFRPKFGVGVRTGNSRWGRDVCDWFFGIALDGLIVGEEIGLGLDVAVPAKDES